MTAQQDLLLIALKEKYRFSTNRLAELTLEQLFDLPLMTTSGGHSLDAAARIVAKALREEGEEDFVSGRSNPLRKVLENKLEIIKLVIGIKQAENDKKLKAAAASAQIDALTEALEKKQQEKLIAGSEEDLLKKIAEAKAKLE